jgi:hypothetical protein
VVRGGSFCAQAEKDYTQLIILPVVPAGAAEITGTTFTLGDALNVCRDCNGGPVSNAYRLNGRLVPRNSKPIPIGNLHARFADQTGGRP